MISRYALPEMMRVWSEEHKLDLWLRVELEWVDVLAAQGRVERAVADHIRAHARVRAERAAELEKVVRHDVIAFLTSVAEELGPEGRFLHFGLTSSDVLDTALALQLLEAGELVGRELAGLREAVSAQAARHRRTVLVGRTHGVHAEPITLGFKLAGWYTELGRGADRLSRAIEGVRVGKLSGAVGIHGTTDPEAEREALSRLGLRPEPVATQVVPRDRHAEYVFALAVLGAAVERMATEIRNLARPEIGEVEEPFYSGQKGSSAMPHKRNPVLCERLAGLARLLRANLLAALENVALWHERDISHSSVERVILPDSTMLLHFMLVELRQVVADLVVHPERMAENLARSRGVVFSQRVLLALIERGADRDLAYRVVQRVAGRCWSDGVDFGRALEEDPEVGRWLDSDGVRACLDVGRHLEHLDAILERAGIDPVPGGSSRYVGLVRVLPKREVFDPAGRAVESALRQLGFACVGEVRLGKLAEVSLTAATREEAGAVLEEMGRRLLANPVIEDFELAGIRLAHA